MTNRDGFVAVSGGFVLTAFAFEAEGPTMMMMLMRLRTDGTQGVIGRRRGTMMEGLVVLVGIIGVVFVVV